MLRTIAYLVFSRIIENSVELRVSEWQGFVQSFEEGCFPRFVLSNQHSYVRTDVYGRGIFD